MIRLHISISVRQNVRIRTHLINIQNRHRINRVRITNLFRPRTLPSTSNTHMPTNRITILPYLLTRQLINTIRVSSLSSRFIFLNHMEHRVRTRKHISTLIQTSISTIRPRITNVISNLRIRRMSFTQTRIRIRKTTMPRSKIVLQFIRTKLKRNMTMKRLSNTIRFKRNRQNHNLRNLKYKLRHIITLITILNPNQYTKSHRIPNTIRVSPITSSTLKIKMLSSLRYFPFSMSFRGGGIIIFIVRDAIVTLLYHDRFLISTSVLWHFEVTIGYKAPLLLRFIPVCTRVYRQ